MKSRNSLMYVLLIVLPAVGLLGLAPTSNAAPAGQYLLNPGQSAKSDVIQIKKRVRGPRLYVPIAPSYLYYDYPYYYRRGFYPTHIGPGFVYYGYPYSAYVRSSNPRYGGRCSYWYRKCDRDWGDHRPSRRTAARSFGGCTCP